MTKRSKLFHSLCRVCDRFFATHDQLVKHLGGLTHEKKANEAEKVDAGFLLQNLQLLFSMIPQSRNPEERKKS